MPNHYLTAIQAETMARLYYGLPPRSYKGKPLPRQHLVWQALRRKQLVSGKYLTEKGLHELRSYCKLELRRRT